MRKTGEQHREQHKTMKQYNKPTMNTSSAWAFWRRSSRHV